MLGFMSDAASFLNEPRRRQSLALPGFLCVVVGGSRVRRQHGEPIINVFGIRRNLAVLWGLSVGLAVLRNRYLTVIGRRHSGLAVVRSRCGRLTIGRGWLVEVRSGCARSGARSGEVRSGLVEVRGCGSAVRCAVSTLRHRGSYCVIVETCAFRLAGHSHEHDVDD